MTRSAIEELRRFGRRFVVSISGGGASFISDYLSVPGASATFLEGLVPYSQDATDEFLGFSPEKYCSERTARLLASRAYRRAEELENAAKARLGDQFAPTPLFGVGATASLASDRPKKGAHRVHCAVVGRDRVVSATLELLKDDRARFREERLAADFILSVALYAAKLDLTEPWKERAEELRVDASEALYPDEKATVSSARPDENGEKLLFDDRSEIRALRWIDGAIDRALTRADEPPEGLLLYPGSFNPPHRAHAGIVSSPVELELSAQNVDKPPIDALELTRRLTAISKALPGVPVWVDKAPRFAEKSELFPGATFVVGTDTILRLADPKYERDSPKRRDAAIKEIEKSGARFRVFARKIEGKIVSKKKLSEKLPTELRALCDFVGEDVFLDDVSSSEIRKNSRQSTK